MSQFSLLDYGVFTLSLVLSLFVGIWISYRDRHDTSTSGYLFGNRKMPLVPTAISILATAVSSLFLLTLPGETVAHGSSLLWWPFLYMINSLVMAFVVLPKLYHVHSSSMYAYFEERFGSISLRIYSSLLYALSALTISGVLQYTPAVAMTAVMRVPLWLVITSVGSICTAYTVLGGLRGVVWADTIQAVVIYAGLIVMIIRGASVVGGFDASWQIAKRNDFFADFTTFTDVSPFQRQSAAWILVGGMFVQMAMMIGSQSLWQRCRSMSSLRRAQASVLLAGVLTTVVALLLNVLAIIMHSYYSLVGNPFQDGRVHSKDQLVLLFMTETFSGIPGLSGLFLAAIISATLSTVSSSINALSAVAHAEIVSRILGRDDATGRSVMYARCSSVIFGGLTIALAFAVAPMGGAVQAVIGVFGALNGPLLGLILLGVLSKSVGARAALVGVACGSLVGVSALGCYAVGQLRHPTNFTQLPMPDSTRVSAFNLSPLAFGTAACLATIVVSCLVARCVRERQLVPTWEVEDEFMLEDKIERNGA